MDERELEIETVSDGGGSLGASGVRRDDYAVGNVEILSDPSQHTWLCVEVVYGHVEEALDLTGMEVHGDDVVAASRLQHVCHELGGDGCTALVFLILAGVGEVGDYGSDASCRGSFAGINHDEEFHESVINIIRTGGL